MVHEIVASGIDLRCVAVTQEKHRYQEEAVWYVVNGMDVWQINKYDKPVAPKESDTAMIVVVPLVVGVAKEKTCKGSLV
jgi:hypothetical protein